MVGEGKLPWADVNTVINNLCQKLGVTFDQLVPEIVRMQTSKMLAFIAVLVVICVVVLLMYWSVCKRTDGDSGYKEALDIISIMLLSGLAFALVAIIPMIVSYIASPRAAALRWILRQLR